MHNYLLNDQGEPVLEPDILKWAAWFERASANGGRVVAFDRLPNGTEVSTVFLGIDHNWGRHGPPVLWETMIFGGTHNGEQWRYCSKADALIGHAKAVGLAAEDGPSLPKESNP